MTTLTQPPAIPDRALGQAAYNAAVAAWLAWQVINGSEMAAFITQFDPLASNYSTIVAIANFKGNWSSLTGALNMPASVYHNERMWALTQNLANVTTATPGVSSAWVSVKSSLWTRLSTTSITAGSSQVTVTNIPQDYADISIVVPVAVPSSTQALQLSYSTNNGSSWLGPVAVTSAITNAQSVAGEIMIIGYRRTAASIIPVIGLDSGSTVASFTNFGIKPNAAINAIRLSWTGGATFSGGSVSIDARV